MAFTVLMVALLPLSYMLDAQIGASAQDRNQVAALALAEKWVEVLANQSPPTLTTTDAIYQCGVYSNVTNPGTNTGEPVVGEPLTPVQCTATSGQVAPQGTAVPTATVGAMTYHLSADYFWTADQNGTTGGAVQPNLCSDVSEPKVLELVVKVSWHNGGQTVQDSVLLDYPPPGIQINGYVAVQIDGDTQATSASGASWSSRVTSIPVTFTQSAPLVSGGPTQASFVVHPNKYGCAFAEVEPGTWQATVGDPGSELQPADPVSPSYVTDATPPATQATSTPQVIGIGETTSLFPGGVNYDQGSLVDLAYPATTAVADGVECPSVGHVTCFAGGQASNGTVALATFDGSNWAAVPGSELAGTTRLEDAACGAECIGVGFGPNGTGTQGVIVAQTTGTPQTVTVQSFPNVTELSSVACPSSSTCVAIGDGSSGGVLEASTNIGSGDTWTAQTLPAGVSFLSTLACPTATECAVGGGNASGGLVLTGTVGGTWSVGAAPSGVTVAAIWGLTCQTDLTCTAIGSGATSTGGSNGPLVLSSATPGNGNGIGEVSNLAWTVDTISPPSGMTIDSLGVVRCPSATECLVTAAETATSSSSPVPSGSVVLSGAPGGQLTVDTTPAPISTVSDLTCPDATTCVLTGSNAGTPLVLTGAVGSGTDTWTANTLPTPSSGEIRTVGSLACPTAGACLLVAGGTDASGGADALLLAGSLATSGSGTSSTVSGTWSIADLPSTLTTAGAGEARYFTGISCVAGSSTSTCAATGASAVGPVLLTSSGGPGGTWTAAPASLVLTGMTVTGIPLELQNAGLAPQTSENAVAASAAQSSDATTLGPLYPFNPGYSLYAADCTAELGSTKDASSVVAPTVPGSTGGQAVTVPLGMVAFDVISTSGIADGATLTLTATTAGCAADTYTLPTTGPDGLSRTTVPFGTYTLTITSGSTTATATVTVTSAAVTVNGAVVPLPGPAVIVV